MSLWKISCKGNAEVLLANLEPCNYLVDHDPSDWFYLETSPIPELYSFLDCSMAGSSNCLLIAQSIGSQNSCPVLDANKQRRLILHVPLIEFCLQHNRQSSDSIRLVNCPHISLYDCPWTVTCIWKCVLWSDALCKWLCSMRERLVDNGMLAEYMNSRVLYPSWKELAGFNRDESNGEIKWHYLNSAAFLSFLCVF